MEEQDIKKIIFDYLNDEHFLAELKTKLFNLNGLRPQADFEAQEKKINELENERSEIQQTLEELKNKVTEFESANDALKTKLEQVNAQYRNDETKLEQYRTDMKDYLEKVEEQEKEISELESENKKLQAQLTEAEEHFKTASAESIKHLQELNKLKEKLDQPKESDKAPAEIPAWMRSKPKKK